MIKIVLVTLTFLEISLGIKLKELIETNSHEYGPGFNFLSELEARTDVGQRTKNNFVRFASKNRKNYKSKKEFEERLKIFASNEDLVESVKKNKRS